MPHVLRSEIAILRGMTMKEVLLFHSLYVRFPYRYFMRAHFARLHPPYKLLSIPKTDLSGIELLI